MKAIAENRTRRDKLQELEDEAMDYLKGFFTRKLKDEDCVKGRIASSVLSTASRSRQTDRAWAGTVLTLGRALAEDPQAFRRYVTVVARQLPVLKELPLPEKPAA